MASPDIEQQACWLTCSHGECLERVVVAGDWCVRCEEGRPLLGRAVSTINSLCDLVHMLWPALSDEMRAHRLEAMQQRPDALAALNACFGSNHGPDHVRWDSDHVVSEVFREIQEGEGATLVSQLASGDLVDHQHPSGDCCDEPDCYQAHEMYPEGS